MSKCETVLIENAHDSVLTESMADSVLIESAGDSVSIECAILVTPVVGGGIGFMIIESTFTIT